MGVVEKKLSFINPQIAVTKDQRVLLITIKEGLFSAYFEDRHNNKIPYIDKKIDLGFYSFFDREDYYSFAATAVRMKSAKGGLHQQSIKTMNNKFSQLKQQADEWVEVILPKDDATIISHQLQRSLSECSSQNACRESIISILDENSIEHNFTEPTQCTIS